MNRVASLEETVVRSRQRIDAGHLLTDKKGGGRQAIEIFGLERSCAACLGELVVGLRPCLSRVRLSSPVQRSRCAHARIIAHSRLGE